MFLRFFYESFFRKVFVKNCEQRLVTAFTFLKPFKENRDGKLSNIFITLHTRHYQLSLLAVVDRNLQLEDYLCKFLPEYPICADSKDEFRYQKKIPRITAISQNRWLSFNQSWVNLLIFDLDYFITIEDARELCILKIGIEPTWICATEQGVHIAYALENMVKYEWDTIRLVSRIKRAVTDALLADVKASHRLKGFFRNPALHYHIATFKKYALADFYPLLNEYTKNNFAPNSYYKDYLTHHHQTLEHDVDYHLGNRNAALFYKGMELTKNGMGFEEVEDIVLGLHSSFIESEQVVPLGFREVMRTINSIARYCAENRNFIYPGSVKRKHHDNAGAMQFAPMRGMDENEYRDERVRRQSLSALRTASRKKKVTTNRIKEAILRLNFLGLDLTHANIALYAERSRATVSRYLSEGFVEIELCIKRTMSISSYIVIAVRTLGMCSFFVSVPLKCSFEKKDIGRFREWRIVSPP